MPKQCVTLTAREMDVLMTICSGITHRKEIAAELDMAAPTARTHITNIYRKVGVRNMTDLVLFVICNSALRLICFPWLKARADE